MFALHLVFVLTTTQMTVPFARHVNRYRALDRARLYGLLPHAGDDVHTDIDEYEQPLRDMYEHLRDIGFLHRATFDDFAEIVALFSVDLPVVRLPRPPIEPPQRAIERKLARMEEADDEDCADDEN